MAMKITLLAIAFNIISILKVTGQPTIQWQVSLGGSLVDQIDQGNVINNNMAATVDGGVIIAGHSFSNDGDVTGHHGLSGTSDYWVVKLDSSGSIEWQKSLGGSFDEVAKSVFQTQDGGYIICGDSYSDDGDVSGHHDSTNTTDAWVVKLDAIGNIEWEHSYGGSDFETASHIEQTTDGGYVFTGDSRSSDGDVSINKGSLDFWVVKLDSVGTIEWEKSLGGSGAERAYNFCQTFDGSFLVCGTTTSNDSDITFNAHPGFLWDIWLIKLDSTGNKEWDKCYGGSSLDWGYNIRQTADSGYVLCSATSSTDDDIVGNHGGTDIWLARLDSVGNIRWSKCYGGTSSEQAKSVRETPDKGYLISGSTESSDGDVSSAIGVQDCWIVKTDSMGTIEWEKTYGGTGRENMAAAVPASNAGYFFVGESSSNDIDVAGHHGALSDNDIWAVRLNSLTTNIDMLFDEISAMMVTPNPINSTAVISFNLDQNENVVIDILDVMGKKIKSLVNEQMNAGKHEFAWNPRSENSNLSSGTYFIQIKTSNHSLSQRVVLINR